MTWQHDTKLQAESLQLRGHFINTNWTGKGVRKTLRTSTTRCLTRRNFTMWSTSVARQQGRLSAINFHWMLKITTKELSHPTQFLCKSFSNLLPRGATRTSETKAILWLEFLHIDAVSTFKISSGADNKTDHWPPKLDKHLTLLLKLVSHFWIHSRTANHAVGRTRSCIHLPKTDRSIH